MLGTSQIVKKREFPHTTPSVGIEPTPSSHVHGAFQNVTETIDHDLRGLVLTSCFSRRVLYREWAGAGSNPDKAWLGLGVLSIFSFWIIRWLAFTSDLAKKMISIASALPTGVGVEPTSNSTEGWEAVLKRDIFPGVSGLKGTIESVVKAGTVGISRALRLQTPILRLQVASAFKFKQVSNSSRDGVVAVLSGQHNNSKALGD
ncbi:hypothetical protein FB45DRAFT_864804 [Roridomyces roridus]|uniref:Uncharacterized protein n=1 Tax=Roridomyces roridus TaxID=1738132 RepID=A0AAD7C1P6_9AGAR|nr:hypothetical protein FB45DRAFT_864804 [Roridomyces roridus]